jgi:hypothetical protein
LHKNRQDIYEGNKKLKKGYYRAANSYLEMKKFEEALEILNKVDNLEKQEELINLKKQVILKKEEVEFCIKSIICIIQTINHTIASKNFLIGLTLEKSSTINLNSNTSLTITEEYWQRIK